MSGRIRAALSLVLGVLMNVAALAEVQLPLSYNSNTAGYGPPAAQFFSACTPYDQNTGAPLTSHVSWIWSTGGGGPVYCQTLTDHSRIGANGSGGLGYAPGDIIILYALNGNTTAPARAVVTQVSQGGAVKKLTFDGPAGSGGIFYPPDPTAFVQASTTGNGTGFKLAQPDFELPVDLSAVPNVNSGGYLPFYLDNGHLSNCNLQCWQQSHPNWIAYDCDKTTPAFYQRVLLGNVAAVTGGVTLTMSPTEAAELSVGLGAMTEYNGAYIGRILRIDVTKGTVTLDTKFADISAQYSMVFANMKSVPLNWTNPAVQSYILQWATAYIQGGTVSVLSTGSNPSLVLSPGFGSINFDMVNVNNMLGVCGYYAGAKVGVGTAPSFGGAWTPLFSGLVIDQSFSNAAINYACSMTAAVHTLGSPAPFTAANVGGVGNALTSAANLNSMIACFDLWIDEATFFSCKEGPTNLKILTGAGFARALATIQTMEPTVPLASVSYLCESVGTQATALTTFQAAGEVWASAVFYLLQSPSSSLPTYMGMVGFTRQKPLDHARYVPYDPSWFPAIGAPVDQGHLNAGGCYERHYTNGLVELNAGANTCSFTVPANAKDQFGNAITSGLLPPLPANRSQIACSTPTTHVSTCSAVVISTQ